jgi:hypothetical protein
MALVVLVVACRDDAPTPTPPPKRPPDRALDDNLRELNDRPIGKLDHAPGTPLDVARLGSAPHVFGDLASVSPGMRRSEVKTRLPAARVDGATLVAATGIADTTAVLTFDHADELDIITYYMPASARATLIAAWGQPDEHDAWLDRAHGLRADTAIDRPSGQLTLSIEDFRPFGALLGKNPDGLADDMPPLVGAGRAELAKAFGAHLVSAEPLGGVDDARTLEILLPATEACRVGTTLLLDMSGNMVDRVVMRPCYADEVARRAILAAMEKAWGRATPGRSRTDRPTFDFAIPNRHISATILRAPDTLDEVWEVAIGR